MKVNVQNKVFTHQGGPAVQVTAYQQLRRTVLACLLFEDNFYENGVTCVERIKDLCTQVKCHQILDLASIAATQYHLRHVPLLLIVEALKHKDKPHNTHYYIDMICTRPDQLTDLLALYFKDGRKPIPYQLKRGMAKAFSKFDEYQLAKYNKDDPVKLRDVLFLSHAKPKDEAQDQLWKRLINKTLATPETWETKLSAGEDKKESFQHLLERNKMGKLAILRNMRNMYESGVPKELVASALMTNLKPMLPFQYIAAARAVPHWEDILDAPMIQSASFKPKMPGKTIVLVDVSGSMDYALSSKSTMFRSDAACAMAILLKECCESIEIYSFSNALAPIPNRSGIALRDAIISSQVHSGTYLGGVLTHIVNAGIYYDRLIVITDEQAADNIPHMRKGKNYILNIGTYANGIGNINEWQTITGFSEASIDFIYELENFS